MDILAPKMYILTLKMYILTPKMYISLIKLNMYLLAHEMDKSVYLLKRYSPSDNFCTFFSESVRGCSNRNIHKMTASKIKISLYHTTLHYWWRHWCFLPSVSPGVDNICQKFQGNNYSNDWMPTFRGRLIKLQYQFNINVNQTLTVFKQCLKQC